MRGSFCGAVLAQFWGLVLVILPKVPGVMLHELPAPEPPHVVFGIAEVGVVEQVEVLGAELSGWSAR